MKKSKIYFVSSVLQGHSMYSDSNSIYLLLIDKLRTYDYFEIIELIDPDDYKKIRSEDFCILFCEYKHIPNEISGKIFYADISDYLNRLTDKDLAPNFIGYIPFRSLIIPLKIIYGYLPVKSNDFSYVGQNKELKHNVNRFQGLILKDKAEHIIDLIVKYLKVWTEYILSQNTIPEQLYSEKDLTHKTIGNHERLEIMIDKVNKIILDRITGETNWEIRKSTTPKHPRIEEIIARLPEQYR
jgi:hypothetical protein